MGAGPSLSRINSAKSSNTVLSLTQAGVGLVGSALGGGPSLSRSFHAALEASIANTFKDNHAINCMCHSTENMYRCVGVWVCGCVGE